MKNAALITGSARKIGKEIAVFLARAGYDIAIHYNKSVQEAREVSEVLKNYGINTNIYCADLNEEESVLKLIKDVQRGFPHLNLLVNSASIFVESSLKETDEKLFNSTMNINFKAPFILSREFAKYCKVGQIINILDTRISKNNTSHFIYTISKKTLAEFTKLASVELAPNIRVNGIAPGLILPPPGKDEDYLDTRAQSLPLKKKGNVEDVLGAIDFFLKNNFVTGQFLYVDGGENL